MPLHPHNLAHYHLDPSRRLIYASIPKNACTTLKAWFLENLGIAPARFDRGELHDFARRHHNLACLSEAEAREWLERATVFAFVREPIGRIVSAYLNKFVTPMRRDGERINHSLQHAVEAFHRQRGRTVTYDAHHAMQWGGHVLKIDSSIDYERGLSFREFVDYLCEETDDLALNGHWRPQWRFLEGIRVDFLGRVETLDQDMAELCRRLDLTPPRLPARNRTAYASPANDLPAGSLADALPADLRHLPALPSREQLVSPELHDRLARRYAEDIRRFG